MPPLQQKQNDQTNKRALREQQRGARLDQRENTNGLPDAPRSITSAKQRPIPAADTSAAQPVPESEPLTAPQGDAPVNYLSTDQQDQNTEDQGFTPEAERLLGEEEDEEEDEDTDEEYNEAEDTEEEEDEDIDEEPIAEEPTSGTQEQPGWQEPEPAADYSQPGQYEQFPEAAPTGAPEPPENREQDEQAAEQEAQEQAAAEAAAAEQEQRRQLEAEQRAAAQEKNEGPMGAVAGMMGGDKKDEEDDDNPLKKAKKIRMYATIGCALFSLLMGLVTIMGGMSLLEGLM